jgi:hypothetical protein
MESWWVMHHLGKIPNMPSQGFTCGLSHREVLPNIAWHGFITVLNIINTKYFNVFSSLHNFISKARHIRVQAGRIATHFPSQETPRVGSLRGISFWNPRAPWVLSRFSASGFLHVISRVTVLFVSDQGWSYNVTTRVNWPRWLCPNSCIV